MTINNAVSATAGAIIMVSLLLSNSNMFAQANWLWLTFFVGFNLFQSAFTGFCPAAKIFKAIGLKG
ncbi:YgaP family membrane protein [Candidatus Thioglobus sp.]|uniref:YgaP family membrane protein n=1 Tax=Candidatus Thioglobus sp. TaxID=2026721 RepID=UPI003D097CD0